MAGKTLQLEVVTPDRVVFSEKDVVSVTAPGSVGYVGIMANHAPFMTDLQVGILEFRRADNSTDEVSINGGFLEVSDNVVTVLSSSAEMIHEIDITRAEDAKIRAEERLAAKNNDVDAERARASLMRAMNRLKAANHLKTR